MPICNDCIQKPKNLALMEEIANILAFDFVRVDLYEVGGKIFVGELTFTPVGGSARWIPKEIDERLGRLWQ